MRTFLASVLVAFAAIIASAQVVNNNPPPVAQQSAFQDTTVNFNLAPITLPGAKQSITGSETDVKLSLTPDNLIGETNLISSGFSFFGGRYDRIFPGVSKWLNNLSPSLNGYNFQVGLTGSLGVVRTPANLGVNAEHWGERAGAFLNYKVADVMGIGFEAQWDNLPGYAHNGYSVAFGPNFHF